MDEGFIVLGQQSAKGGQMCVERQQLACMAV
jgi:hypothetical protein